MKRYRLWQAWSALWLGSIALFGTILGLAGRHEIFPFYSWFLFAQVPGPTTRYTILLYSLGEGRPLGEPLRLEQAGPDQVPRPHSVAAAHLVQELGRAWRRGDQQELWRLRRVLESTYLPPSCRYALVRFQNDPLEQWRGQQRSTDEEVVATFQYGVH
jgi:hypothetical protein